MDKNDELTNLLKANAILYCEAYIAGFNDTLSTYYSEEIAELENNNYPFPYLWLFNKKFGEDFSIAVFISESYFFLLFLKPSGDKVYKLINQLDKKYYGKEWLQKTPLEVKKEEVLKLLNIPENLQTDWDVQLGGCVRFLLQPEQEIRLQGEDHGRSKANLYGPAIKQYLPQIRNQVNHTTTVLSFKKRYDELVYLYENDQKSHNISLKIGHEFEKLWRELLDYRGWQSKKIILKGQGNDFTAIFDGNHILGEVRWLNRPLDGDEIRAFLGKLDPRPQTLGLIISFNGFNEGAYEEAKRSISKKTVVFFDRKIIEEIICKLSTPGEVFARELRNVYDYLFEKRV